MVGSRPCTLMSPQSVAERFGDLDHAALLSARASGLTDSAIRAITKEIARRTGITSFAGGVPAPETFPVARIQAACEAVLSRHAGAALQYAATAGHAPLREWIAGELVRQGSRVAMEQVQITTGSQQALDLLGKVLIDAGDRVGVEAPTYVGALQALGVYQPAFVSLACDDEGVQPAALAESALKLAYLTPTFQNPTGRTVPRRRREQLVEAAARAGALIIEDDPYGALDYAGHHHASLHSMNPAGVVYLGSFSKILAPGLRLGYVVGPEPLVRKIEQAKQSADLHTSSFVQMVVYEALQDDFLPAHLVKTRSFYAARCQAMMQALASHFSGKGVWTEPAGGIFTWLQLNAEHDASQLLALALDRQIAFVPGAPFFAHHPAKNTLRLSFAATPEPKIHAGIATLSQVLDEFRLSGRPIQGGTSELVGG